MRQESGHSDSVSGSDGLKVCLMPSIRAKVVNGRLDFFDSRNGFHVRINKGQTERILRILNSSKINDSMDRKALTYLTSNGLVKITRKTFQENRPLSLELPNLENLIVQLNTLCNLRCRICYLQKKDCSGPETADLKKLLDEADFLGANRLTFTGGEPFLRKDILEIVGYAKEKNFWVNIITNGTLLNEELVSKLKELDVNQVSVSIDSHLESVNDFQRGDGSYRRIMNSLKLLKKYNLDIRLNLVLTKTNVSYLKDYLDFFWKKFKIKNVAISPMASRGAGKESGDGITSLEFGKAMKVEHDHLMCHGFNHLEASSDLDRNFEVEPPESKGAAWCGVGNSMAYVTSKGILCLCPTLTSYDNPRFSFGNVYSEGLSLPWSRLHLMYKGLSCRKGSSCKHWAKCMAGCRSDVFLSGGGLNSCDLGYRKGLELIEGGKDL